MAGSSTDAPTAGPTITVYGCTCPLKGECTSGGSFFKGQTLEQAKKRLWNHLKHSTYHGLTVEDANGQVEAADFEQWEEEQYVLREWEEENEIGWSRRKRRQGAAPYAAALPTQMQRYPGGPGIRPYLRSQLTDAFPEASGGAVCGGADRSSLRLHLRNPSAPVPSGVPLDGTVVMTGSQCQVVMDSLTRTRMCAKAMEDMATKAAVAFRQESENIAELQDTLHSWFSNVHT